MSLVLQKVEIIDIGARETNNLETITTQKTIISTDARLQVLTNNTSALDVVLPLVAAAYGPTSQIKEGWDINIFNSISSTFHLIVKKSDDSTEIVHVYPGETYSFRSITNTGNVWGSCRECDFIGTVTETGNVPVTLTHKNRRTRCTQASAITVTMDIADIDEGDLFRFDGVTDLISFAGTATLTDISALTTYSSVEVWGTGAGTGDITGG